MKMVITAISIITSLAIVLLIGLIISIFSQKLRVPDALFLILAGIGLSLIERDGTPIIMFPELFLTGTTLLALALVVFDGSIKIKIRSLDVYSLKALKLTGIFLVFELVLFMVAAKFILNIPVSTALFFAAIVGGSSSDVMTTMFSGIRNKMIEILKLESIFNTPIVVIIPFLLLDFLYSLKSQTPDIFLIIEPFIVKIVAGVGSGAVLFVLLYKVVNQRYSRLYTPLSVIVSAILAFVLAENIGGDGVLSVTTLGLLFGNFITKKKGEIITVESIFSKALYVLVFILIGITISVPESLTFVMQSLLLFGIYLIIRFFVVMVTFASDDFTFGEKLFASLQSTKGIATATLVLTFAITVKPVLFGVENVLEMALMFIVYSLILSTITIKLSGLFFKHDKNNS